ncbi:g12725 [Coccomyxa viridis]|uniref:G12725 protein n=1 Tax=Coccomyxa viridis TaxID=1274662 RepID=A0ABP1GF65_9CHLO
MRAKHPPHRHRLRRAWVAIKTHLPGTTEHKEMYDYKLHTGYIGTSAFERFKSHLPGTVEYRVRYPNHCGLEVSATGAFGPGADPTARPCTGSPQFRTGIGYGGHPAGGAAAGYPYPCYTRSGWRWDILEEDMALAAMADILHLWPDDSRHASAVEGTQT